MPNSLLNLPQLKTILNVRCGLLLICLTISYPIFSQINKDSLLLITKNGIPAQRIVALNILSDAFVYEQPAQAKAYALQALKLSNNTENDSGRADAYNRLGVAYDVSGDYDSAMIFYEKALPVYMKLKSQKGIGSAYNNMGLIAWNQGNYDKALGFLFDALQNFEAINNEKFMANVFNNIGLVYLENAKPALAIDYHKKALALYLKRNDNYNLASIFNNLSDDYSTLNNIDSSILYNKKAIAYNKLVNDDYGLGIAYTNAGLLQIDLKKYDSAKYYLFKALPLKERIQESKGICIIYQNLGYISQKLNKPEETISYLNKAKEIAQRENLKNELQKIYHQLSAYYAKDSPALALQYYQKYSTLKDSVFNETKSKQITELNTKYEVGKKELTLKEQKLAILKKNYLLGALVGGSLLLTLLLISYYRRSQLQQQKKAQTDLLEEQQKSTISVLAAEEKERKRVAAELHDGVGQMMSVARMHLSEFQTLAIASGVEYKNKYDHLAGLIDESCAEVRTISHQMMPNALIKQGLAKAVRDFITQVKNPKLAINLYTEGLEENLPQNTSAMLYRIIQECVNNVIKHSNATSLDICVMRTEAQITATIEDNGQGFIDSLELNEGIGLQNIRDRVKFLKGELEINSSPGMGTFIALHIPLG